MTFAHWFAFLSIAVVTVLSPGPAVLLAVRNGVQRGFRRALLGIVGNGCALITYATLATLGLAVLLHNAPQVAGVIQIIGGAYLVYLGVRFLRAARVVRDEAPDTAIDSHRTVFVEAYFVGISNPKAIVFYAALFPQFIDASGNVAAQAVVLSLTMLACSMSGLASYAWLASRARHAVGGARFFRALDRVAGGIYIVLGTGLVARSAAKLA